MFEIRLHGRGGQGVVLASRLLAWAFFKEGKFVQAFPSFGAERRGAPVIAYARASDNEIRARYGIYRPNCVIVLDPSLVKGKGVTPGLKPDRWVIINTHKNPDSYPELGAYRVATVDASAIALEHHLGTSSMPMVNTTILGALPRVTHAVTIGSIVDAIREHIPSGTEDNARAALEAYESLKCQDPLSP